jgi:hypothetical protein
MVETHSLQRGARKHDEASKYVTAWSRNIFRNPTVFSVDTVCHADSTLQPNKLCESKVSSTIFPCLLRHAYPTAQLGGRRVRSSVRLHKSAIIGPKVFFIVAFCTALNSSTVSLSCSFEFYSHGATALWRHSCLACLRAVQK